MRYEELTWLFVSQNVFSVYYYTGPGNTVSNIYRNLHFKEEYNGKKSDDT